MRGLLACLNHDNRRSGSFSVSLIVRRGDPLQPVRHAYHLISPVNSVSWRPWKVGPGKGGEMAVGRSGTAVFLAG